MAIFGKNKTAAMGTSIEPEIKAAVGFANTPGISNNPVNNFFNYVEGERRGAAMQLATVSRARDLLASVISCMPLKMYGEMWNDADGEMEKLPLAPRSWLRQPDPSVTYNFLMAWTLDDLLFYGRAYWYIQERTADGFPSKFKRLPVGSITLGDTVSTVPFGPSQDIYFAGNPMNSNDIVQFLSPIQGIVYSSQQTIATALKIEDSRYTY
ncbi:MAG: hypothetical protein ACRCWC_06415, partial [Plesiomonas shigelloides]